MKELTQKIRRSFLETVKEYDMLRPGDSVLCGFSGGADSVVLLHLLLNLKEELGLTVYAAHVNHGIRGEEADRDESFCTEFCREYHIKLFCEHANVPEFAAKHGKSLEDAARSIRYAVFRRICTETGINRIALAHNADDNLETVLYNLVRGSGLTGICGIPPVRGTVIRPLLSCKKTDICGYCRENGLSYVTDSTNSNPAYARNFIRTRITPLLSELNPEVQQAFYSVSALARCDEEALRQAAAPFTLTDGRERLAALPDALFDRILLNEYRAFLQKGETAPQAPLDTGFSAASDAAENKKDSRLPTLSARQIAALRHVIRAGNAHARVSLPGGISLVCDRDTLRFTEKNAQKTVFEPAVLHRGTNPAPDGVSLLFLTEADSSSSASSLQEIKAFKNIYKFFKHVKINPVTIEGTITVRTRCPGDTYRIRSQTKSVKKLFQSKKLTEYQASHLPVLCDEKGILWIPGFPPRDGCQAENGNALFLYYFI